MKATPLGGGSEVGASCIHIEISGRKLLADAGIRMNERESAALPDLDRLSGLGGIDAVLVTHAHMDHIGALPLVHRMYPECPIYATPATVRLMVVLLADALRIMQTKAEEEAEIPLYDLSLVQSMFRKVVPVNFGDAANIGSGEIEARFHPSGHVLGASAISIRSPEGSLMVSGDLSLTPQRTVPGMSMPNVRTDAVVLESTYGNRAHSSRRDEELRLAESVRRTVKKGGKVLVPAFALGRAQEVILILQAYQATGLIPQCPIWVDGMVRSICEVYNSFPELVAANLRNRIENEGNPFYYKRGRAKAVTTPKQRTAILKSSEPCVVVASSGMLSGGASPIYAEAIARNPANAIILTGYQDEESPGRRLLRLVEKGGGEFELNGGTIEMRCHIDQIGLSAHADAGELASLVKSLGADSVILVHGDDDARSSLAGRLEGFKVYTPQNGETVSVKGSESGNAFGGISGGRQPKGFSSLEELWAYLADGKPLKAYTVPELAPLWASGTSGASAMEELEQALSTANPFFEKDWKNPMLYKPREAEKLRRSLHRRSLIDGADLRGYLVLVRNNSRKVYPAVCFEMLPDGFQAWKVGTPSTHHRAEELLEVIGPWPLTDSSSGATEKPKLRQLELEVRKIYKELKPEKLLAVLSGGDDWATPESAAARLGLDGDDIKVRIAVAWRLNTHHDLVERSSAGYGRGLYRLKAPEPPYVQGQGFTGALVEKINEKKPPSRMEQNQAMELVERLMPGVVYKKGVSVETGTLKLYLNFPDADTERFSAEIARLEAMTGWGVALNGTPNMNALKEAARSALPDDGRTLKEPSVHTSDKKVVVKPLRPLSPDEAETARRAFRLQTGWSLEFKA